MSLLENHVLLLWPHVTSLILHIAQRITKNAGNNSLVGDLLCSTELCLEDAFQELVGLFVAYFLWLYSLGQQKSQDLNRAYLQGKAAFQDCHLG